MFCFASYVCRVNFYGRNSVGFSGVVSLISLSGYSKFALSSVCVGSLVELVTFYFLVVPLLVVSLLQQVY